MAETRKLAAILAADVAGYSKLAGAEESGRWRVQASPPLHWRPKLARDGAFVGFADPGTATSTDLLGRN
jgi:hypothetical protein